MIAFYLGAFLFGGIVLGASMLLGGHDDGDAEAHGDAEVEAEADADAEIEADGADHDHDHGHGAFDKAIDKHVDLKSGDLQWFWLPFLSVRFWTFFAASFGATGLALSLVGPGEPWTGLISTPFGLGIGYAAALAFRRVQGDQVSGDVGLGRYVGLEAKVIVPVRPGEVGKIAVDALSGRLELPARTRDGKVLEHGATVLIADIDHGTADVTGLTGPEATRAAERASD